MVYRQGTCLVLLKDLTDAEIEEPIPRALKEKPRMTKVEQLKELKDMLDQNLINQDEYERLRTEILQPISPQSLPPQSVPSGGRPFSVPAAPLRGETFLQNPVTGQVVTLQKWPTFGLTLLFGCFYLAYHGAWWNALISLALAWITWGLAWVIYPFFTYRFLVDSYRRRGWVVMPPGLPRTVPVDEFLNAARNHNS
jgi:hypothetical protein